ncbi:MAG TPA: N-acetyltransferase [Chryseobacterium sp.]|nr:N-acetyltransferase [Chryseobacterium sp.]
MEIRKLKIFEENFIPDPDYKSYETEKIFVVSTIETANSFEFNLREKNQYYQKICKTELHDIEYLNAVAQQGHSFGIFENEELIGWIICDYRGKNNSLFIENLWIHKKFRKQNIGRLLIKNINREARNLQCRIVEAELSNTNYPAIKFFLKAGFQFTGINTKLYNNSTETALFMSFDLI